MRKLIWAWLGTARSGAFWSCSRSGTARMWTAAPWSRPDIWAGAEGTTNRLPNGKHKIFIIIVHVYTFLSVQMNNNNLMTLLHR